MSNDFERSHMLLAIQNELAKLIQSTRRHGRPHRDANRTRRVGYLVGKVWGSLMGLLMQGGAAPYDESLTGECVPSVFGDVYALTQALAAQVAEDEAHGRALERTRTDPTQTPTETP